MMRDTADLIRVASEMRSLLDKGDQLTADERDRLRDLNKAFDEREELIKGRTTTTGGDNMHPDRPGNARDSVWQRELSPFATVSEARSAALSAIEKMGHANDKTRAYMTEVVETQDPQGKFARAVHATTNPDYISAFAKYCVARDNTWTNEERMAVSRAMSLTDTAGGFTVPQNLDPSILISSNGSTNPIRQIARKVIATGDVLSLVAAGATSWSWDAEATEVSDDASTFAGPTITIHKAAGFVPMSLEVYDDGYNIVSEVSRLMSFGKDTLESAAFATGSGSGQPFGIVTALSGTSSEVTATTRSAFGLADLYALDEQLPGRWRGNASWLGHRQALNDVRQFTVAGGADVWGEFGAGQPPTLLGSAAYEASDMTSTITTGNHYLVFGDFSEYVIADRAMLRVERIDHLLGSNRRPSGQRGLYAWYRTGADVPTGQEGAFRILLL